VPNNLSDVVNGMLRWKQRMDKAGELSAREITKVVWGQARLITSIQPNPPIQTKNRLRHNPHIGPRTGEGPNYATGNLNRNIIARTPIREGFGSYVAIVSSTAEYARAVEEGSSNWKSGVKFPYMIPARDYAIKTGRARMIMRGFFNAAMKG
jgi:hypothetical protein